MSDKSTIDNDNSQLLPTCATCGNTEVRCNNINDNKLKNDEICPYFFYSTDSLLKLKELFSFLNVTFHPFYTTRLLQTKNNGKPSIQYECKFCNDVADKIDLIEHKSNCHYAMYNIIVNNFNNDIKSYKNILQALRYVL